MAINYSLTSDNKVKITVSHEAINTETETRDSYTESKVLKPKAELLEDLEAEKKNCENVIAAYNKKRDEIIEVITQVKALIEK